MRGASADRFGTRESRALESKKVAMETIDWVALGVAALHVLLALAVAVYLSVNRKPSSAIAWIMAVVFVPLLGYPRVGGTRNARSATTFWSGPRVASTTFGATVRSGRTGCLRSPCSTGISARCRLSAGTRRR